LIDVSTQDPATDIQAGDWYIQSKDVSTVRSSWTGLAAPVANATRIIYSGTKWEDLAPPNVPYADDALGDVTLGSDGKPNPDNRQGGIVKNATLSQAKAGTDKCDTITPYTFVEALKDTDFQDDILNDIIDGRIGDGTITINQNGSLMGTFTVNQDTDTTIDLTDASLASVPVGAVLAFAANSIPTGFLKCNGATLNKTTYASLFAVLGTTYGGDGVSTFKLPDLRGSFIRGFDDGAGVDDGRSFGSKQDAELGPHKHVFEDVGGTVAAFQKKGRRLSMDTGNGQDDFGQYSMGPGNRGQKHAGLGQLAATGGEGIGEDNHPLNIALLYCIKY